MKTFAEYVRQRNKLALHEDGDFSWQDIIAHPAMATLGGAYWGLRGLAKGVGNTIGGTLYGMQRGFRKPGEAFYTLPDEQVYWAKKKISSAFRSVEKNDRSKLATWVKDTYGN